VSNVRREASIHFRKRKNRYLKDRMNETELNGKNRNIRDIYRAITGLKKAYKPRTTIV
jgi:hypothetical protein